MPGTDLSRCSKVGLDRRIKLFTAEQRGKSNPSPYLGQRECLSVGLNGRILGMIEVLPREFRDIGIYVVSKSQGVDDPILIDIAFAQRRE